MKAIKFKENEYYSIELNYGLYLVDCKYINIETHKEKVQVKDIHTVIPITRTNIIDYYINEDGVKTLSTPDYNDQKDILQQKKVEDEYGNLIWDSLESEYHYKKYIRSWIPVTKNIETIGDPYSFEILESQIDTGNPFIKSDYINGGNDPLLFIYNRPSALQTIVRDKFTSLGMKFKENISYVGTNNTKIWGNSTHSCIEYVVAFNHYIFGKEWNITSLQRGNLDKLLAQYKSDKETVEDIIQINYNIHFGKIDSGNFDFEKLLQLLNHCKHILSSVEVKQKSYNSFSTAKMKLKESINFIENFYK